MARVDILVVAETRAGRVTPLTRELLGLARDLANHPHPDLPAEGEGDGSLPFRGRVRVGAVCFGGDEAVANELIAYGADRAYVFDAPSEEYEGEIWLPNLHALARELRPRAILAPHTPAGADLTPRLAFRLESGAATGCVAVAAEGERLVFARPCYGGNVREALSFSGTAVASVKAGVGIAREDRSRKGEVIRMRLEAIEPRFRIVAREHETGAGKQLEDAKVVVAGGRGLEGAEGFRVLEKLADALDGAVGASRVPCDLGWCPHSWQIGLTGRTVTPDLYFAVGISGAGHHLAGCGNSKAIVAINTDPDAAIFREARFGIVGDYREVVPALTDAFRELKTYGVPQAHRGESHGVRSIVG